MNGYAESNPDSWFQLLVCGRLMLIPLSVAGGWYCFRWSADLFGRRAGFITLLLWCFSPNVLSWSSVVGTDGAATSLGVIARYYFWRWLRSPNWQGALAAGLLLGVTELSKMTWIILFVVWPAMWICSKVLCPNKDRSFSQLLLILLLGLCVLNMGYLCDSSFSCGADYEFKSQLFTSVCDADSFPGNMIRCVPIPFPYDYVRGVDLQRLDFENGRPSFLVGEWRDSGWWYYYIVAAMVKIPCGTLLLFLLATVLKRSAPIEYSSRMRYRDLLVLIAQQI